MKLNIKKYYLYITVFITGAVILILEILGTRIIAPYYGTTIYVWSSLIAVTLISLAIGYFLGGWLADKLPKINVLYLILLLTAISISVLPLIKNFVLIQTNALGAMYGALVSAGILFTIPLLLLGMVAPYAIRLKAKELKEIGIVAGSLYGVATIGSFVGAILTGFYLIPNMSINSIIYLSAGLLMSLSLIWFISNWKKKLVMCSLGVFIFMIFLNSVISVPTLNEDVKIIYETEGPYARLKVIDEFGMYRYLLVDGATHTQYNLNSKEFMFAYLKLFEKAVNYHSNPKDVLVIGLGGGGIDKQLEQHNLNIDNVEIDSKVVELAENYFNFKGSVVIDDGRHYIRNTDKKYDIVYLDVYNGYSIYPYLFSREAFEEIKDVLNKNGILVINTIGYEDGHLSTNDTLILSIHKTLKEVFPNVHTKTIGYGLTSFVFYASDSELNLDGQFVSINVPDEGIIVTDNYNPLDSYAVDAIEGWRTLNIRRFGYAII